MDICSEALCLYISLWHKVLLKSKLNEICSQMTKVGAQKWEKWDWTGIELNNCGYFELQLYQNHLIYEKTESIINHLYMQKSCYMYIFFQFPFLFLVQFSSVAQLCPTLCDHMNRSMPDLPVHHQLLESSWWCHPTISSSVIHPLLFLPPIPPIIRVFSNESTFRMRWPKYWSFSFNIRPSNEHPGLTSFRMDWLDLLAGHGTLKSLFQHHSSKASIFWHSAFFTVQLSLPSTFN